MLVFMGGCIYINQKYAAYVFIRNEEMENDKVAKKYVANKPIEGK